MAFDLKTPNYLLSIESNIWIFAVFGFACKYLNKPSKALSYLSQAAYPIYILHMVFMFLAAVLILPLEMPVFAKFVMVIAFTTVGSFILYELLIKRIGFLRPLFGLKTRSVLELSVKY
ncbi:hypothetical protein [Labilibaculum sp.]|uniref:hypothetical protein n=1 Tax=Labilibaculum sp. TaxID=2060723 RepID=UPI002AA68767|nr:hypothetical protein [Labilibaculum sp.]MBN2598194.1 hypothetical protein [Marinifilaceae bacterium]